MAHHYSQPITPSSVSVTVSVNVPPVVVRSDVAALPLASDVRPHPADARTASLSPWRRQQQQHQQQPSAHRGLGHHHREKRVRTIFTADQLHRLEAQFERQQYMVGTER